MTARKVLIETIMPESNPVKLIEGKDGGKVWLEGTAIQGEVQNHNGRTYPLAEITNAVASMNERITKLGPILGECDHPEGIQTSVARASHMISKMWMAENDGHARFEVVPVGLGAIVEGFVRRGARLGVSSRGTGNVSPNGLVSEFDIVTIDVVANPSAPNAYPNPIIESAMGTRLGRATMDVATALREDKTAQKHFERQLERFIAKCIGG